MMDDRRRSKIASFSVASFACLFCGSVASAQEQDAATLFGTMPDVVQAVISPGGTRLALATRVDDNILIRLMDLQSRQFLNSMRTTDQLLPMSWIDDSNAVLPLIPAGGGYLAQWVISTEAGGATALGRTGPNQTNAFDIVDFDADDDENIFMTGWQVGGTDLSLHAFRVGLNNGFGNIAYRGNADTAQWYMDGTGHAVIRIDIPEFTQRDEIYRYDGDGDEVHVGTLNENYVDAVRIVGMTEDMLALAVLARREGGRLGLYRYDLATGQLGDTLFFDAENDVDYVLTDDRNFRVVGVTYYDDGARKAVYFSSERQALVDRVTRTIPGKDAWILSRSVDGRKATVMVSSEGSPPQFHLADFNTGELLHVGESYPRLAGVTLGETRPYPYRTVDDVELTGLLTMPPGDARGPLPLVVIPGGRSEFEDANFNYMAHFLANRGYAVLHAGSRHLKTLGDVAGMDELGDWIHITHDDIAHAIVQLSAEGVVDASRVCIMGAQETGYLALSGVAFLNGQYACAVNIDGVVNLRDFLWPPVYGFERRPYVAANIFHSPVHRFKRNYADEDIARYSPLNQVAAVDVPVMLVDYNFDDLDSPIEQLADALGRAGKTVTFSEFEQEEDTRVVSEARIRLLREVDAFLAEHIGN